MYKHILIPTDGSAASTAALNACMRYAREAGARVTVLHVLPAFHVFSFSPDARDVCVQDSEQFAATVLDNASACAQTYTVPCEVLQRRSDLPYQAILAAAIERQCDLIAMATHGAKGTPGTPLGSETHKVLLQTPVPVLLFRQT